MSWTDPPTWTAATLTSSQMNQYVSANLTYLKGIADGLTFSGVQLRRTATQSISSGAWEEVTWQTESGGFDYGSWWASGTDVIVPSGAIPAGYTTIACQVIARTNFAANATGWRGVRILVNGTYTEKAAGNGLSGDVTEVSAFDFVVVGAGDIITTEVYQNSGGALNISATDTKLTVVRFAPVA